MSAPLSLADRVRVERIVWKFDTLTYDLPKRARRTFRRELRTNLLAAAAEHGAAAAIHQLGDLRELAEGYLEAEYGPDGRRPQWRKGIFWALLVDVVTVTASMVGFTSFLDGVQAAGAGAGATGTYHWGGWLGFWGPTADVTLERGEFQAFELEMPLSFFVFPFIAFLIGSRIWRAVPAWWRHRRAARERTA